MAIDKHPRGSTTLLNEFRVNQSKADVVIVNGTSNVYEIKTEFDNFDRLEGQLNSYHYLFDKINVITHPLLVDKLFDTIDNGIGIHTLTESGEIKIIRSAASNIKNIDPVAVLNSLRKEEYLKVLEEEYGRDIKIPNTQVYEEARLLFTNYTPKKAHEKMVIILKNRGQQNSFSEFFGLLPESLNFIGLVGKFTKAEILILRELLPMKLRFT